MIIGFGILRPQLLADLRAANIDKLADEIAASATKAFLNETGGLLEDAVRSKWPLLQFLSRFIEFVAFAGVPSRRVDYVPADSSLARLLKENTPGGDPRTHSGFPILSGSEGIHVFSTAEALRVSEALDRVFPSSRVNSSGLTTGPEGGAAEALHETIDGAKREGSDVYLAWERLADNSFRLTCGGVRAADVARALDNGDYKYLAELEGRNAASVFRIAAAEAKARGHFCSAHLLWDLGEAAQTLLLSDPREILAVRYLLAAAGVSALWEQSSMAGQAILPLDDSNRTALHRAAIRAASGIVDAKSVEWAFGGAPDQETAERFRHRLTEEVGKSLKEFLQQRPLKGHVMILAHCER